MEKEIKIVITGGGTAGHIMPALAVIESLRKKNCQILYVGSKNSIESKIISEKNIKFKKICSGKLRRYFSFKNFIDPFKVFWGFCQSIFIIIKFKPNIVFSKGGYVALPVVLASWLLRKPIIIHESDIELGLTNRISLKVAKILAVSFPPQMYPNLPARKVIYTGNPIRKEIMDGAYERGITEFQLRGELKTLLVIGGSQGAQNINEKIEEILSDLLTKIQIIHITGSLSFQTFKRIKEKLPADVRHNYKIYPFLENNLPDAIAISDLVVSRAGANTIFELAFYKKPTILIPLEGHQEKNANFFAKNKAAYVINNGDLTSLNLLELITRIITHKNQAEILGKNLNSFVLSEAADTIADEIIKLAKY